MRTTVSFATSSWLNHLTSFTRNSHCLCLGLARLAIHHSNCHVRHLDVSGHAQAESDRGGDVLAVLRAGLKGKEIVERGRVERVEEGKGKVGKSRRTTSHDRKTWHEPGGSVERRGLNLTRADGAMTHVGPPIQDTCVKRSKCQ